MKEEDMKFTEVEQTLAEVFRVEKLEIGLFVSLGLHNIVVTNYTSALVQGM